MVDLIKRELAVGVGIKVAMSIMMIMDMGGVEGAEVVEVEVG